MIRNYILGILTCAMSQAGVSIASAQGINEHARSVYLELLGPSNGIGINFDSRFKKGSPWGFRAGFGFGYSKVGGFFGGQSTRIYSVPAGVNYLFGKKKNTLEIGAGINLGIYNDHYTETSINLNKEDISTFSQKKNSFSSFAWLNAGWRYTSKRGFQIRIGLTGGGHLIGNRQTTERFAFQPYISLGKAF